MNKEFSEKTVLITGAATGIGKAVAEAFASEGARVIVVDINPAAGEATTAGIVAAGGVANFKYCDVRDPASVLQLFNDVRSSGARLDCAVNNAAIDPEVTLEPSWDLELFDRVHAINVRGVFLCLKAEIDLMVRQGGGAIVNLASLAALAGIANKPAYVSSKHAVLGLTRAAALQYAAHGVRINAVCPGPVRTSMLQANLDQLTDGEATLAAHIPLGRFSEVHEIADAIIWLCSKRSSSVVGHALSVDGGLAI
jgi:NAD(P)-dependent dehydrogenase (short-subunit alcohol dehydrogenase family)